MNSENKSELLGQIFPDMDAQDLTKLAGVAELKSYPADAVLCQEGEVEKTFYGIVSGQVEVTKKMDDETHQVLNRPGAGNFVGEIALVQEGPRTATVRTVEPTTVLEIDHSDFVSMLNQNASMAVRIMLQITPRLRDIDLSTIAHLQKKNAELAQENQQLTEQIKNLQG